MSTEKSFSKALPVLFGFFIMGFVDVVGIATNYVKKDFALSDTPGKPFTDDGISMVCGIFSSYRTAHEFDRTKKDRYAEYGHHICRNACATGILQI